MNEKNRKNKTNNEKRLVSAARMMLLKADKILYIYTM